MRYLYSVVRFEPDFVGESVNIGVIAGCDENRDWAVRWVTDLSRAKRLADEISPGSDAVIPFCVEIINDAIDAAPKQQDGDMFQEVASEAWLRRLRKDWQNSVRLTDLLPVLSESSSEALSRVRDRLVEPLAVPPLATDPEHPVITIGATVCVTGEDSAAALVEEMHDLFQRHDVDFAATSRLLDDSHQELLGFKGQLQSEHVKEAAEFTPLDD